MSFCWTAMSAAKMAVKQPMKAMTVHARGRQEQQRIDAAEHVDAGGDHGGGVDQRGDGRGAFHGVGQPDVEREHGRFADAAAEEAHHHDAQKDGVGRDALRGGDGVGLAGGLRRVSRIVPYCGQARSPGISARASSGWTETVPMRNQKVRMPTMKPKSARRLQTKALFAASAALSSRTRNR